MEPQSDLSFPVVPSSADALTAAGTGREEGGRSGVRTALWFSRGDCFSSHPSLPPLYKQRSGRTQTSPPPHWPVAELETGRSQSERGNVTCVVSQYWEIEMLGKQLWECLGTAEVRGITGHKHIYYITFNCAAK